MAVVIKVNGIASLIVNQGNMEGKAESDTVALCKNPNDSLTKKQSMLHD